MWETREEPGAGLRGQPPGARRLEAHPQPARLPAGCAPRCVERGVEPRDRLASLAEQASPAGVTCTPRLDRASNSTPSSTSSLRSVSLSADCDRLRSSAAAETLPRSATATK
jgi:hypothetical protein